MSLQNYRSKRHFERTPEPSGIASAKAQQGLRFVIQKHDASRLHYDFRVEIDGVLKSWAVPKGPSLDPAKKSLAVMVEDHPIDYGSFEGVIPKGEYGGGTVLLWDNGTWEPLHDAADGLKAGKFHFLLHGKKLHGEWSLVQMHGKAGEDGKNWLLMKVRDKYASSNTDILADEPASVKSKRSLEQIAGARDAVWSGEAREIGKLAGAVKASFPAKFPPQLATLAESAPKGDKWLHEIKYDGYRLLAWIKNSKVTLTTRSGLDWTAKFPGIAKSLANLKVDSAVIDGEAVVLDENGRSQFEALQASLKDKASTEAVYFAFDMPYSDGFDLRHSPLIDRKAQLEKVLSISKLEPRINYSEHVQGDGAEVVGKACGMGLEGIVSKQMDAPYVSRRDVTWLKSKCGQRQEFVVIGFTDPQGSRSGFGSLLLGYHNDKRQLVYAGRVGTGFDDKMLKKTLKQLTELKQETAPTDLPPPPREQRHANWVKATLVAEVNFTGWTREGVLRHPAFVAFRSDKPAKQIVREVAIKPKDVSNLNKATSSARTKPTARPKAATTFGSGVSLSHPDKILWADSGTTKQQLADYYKQVDQWILPRVTERPLALLRCPGGTSSKCFFQRNWSDNLPAAIDRIDVGQDKKQEFHIMLHNLEGIISMAQMGVLEIHPWNCKSDNIERPDQLIFDLDPGPGLDWKELVRATRIVKATLEGLGLPTFLKTSGGKGLHITIPIMPNIDWDSAKAFCVTIAKSLAEDSELFVANMRKDLRDGKVYIDYNRNGRSATAVAAYSTRARAGAPIAMPITWEELGKLKSADQFKVATVNRYLSKRKTDPWATFEKSRIDLYKVIGNKSAA